MGEPPGFFLHTRATLTHPLVKNWHFNLESEEMLLWFGQYIVNTDL
jgi:hypothetical protein